LLKLCVNCACSHRTADGMGTTASRRRDRFSSALRRRAEIFSPFSARCDTGH
jgi:hypothetical protein